MLGASHLQEGGEHHHLHDARGLEVLAQVQAAEPPGAVEDREGGAPGASGQVAARGGDGACGWVGGRRYAEPFSAVLECAVRAWGVTARGVAHRACPTRGQAGSIDEPPGRRIDHRSRIGDARCDLAGGVDGRETKRVRAAWRQEPRHVRRCGAGCVEGVSEPDAEQGSPGPETARIGSGQRIDGQHQSRAGSGAGAGSYKNTQARVAVGVQGGKGEASIRPAARLCDRGEAGVGVGVCLQRDGCAWDGLFALLCAAAERERRAVGRLVSR